MVQLTYDKQRSRSDENQPRRNYYGHFKIDCSCKVGLNDVQNRNAATGYFTNKQLQSFGLVKQYTTCRLSESYILCHL